MTGFENENNNENQDFGALNMGSGSMFSGAPENIETPAQDLSMFSSLNQGIPEENIGNVPPSPQRKAQTPQAQTPQNPQPPHAPQYPNYS